MWNWHENGAYTGIIPLIFFVFGLILFFVSEFPLVIAGLFVFLVSIGNWGKYSAWGLVHEIPFFNSVHIPFRFIILFIFALALINGFTFTYLWKKIGNKKLQWLLALVLILSVIDLIVVNSYPFSQPFTNMPPQINPGAYFKQKVDDNTGRSGAYSSMYYNLLANEGTLNAYNPIPHQNFAIGVGDPKYKGEVYLENNGNAYYTYWSPNKLVVSVNATDKTRVIINQNYDKGWRVKQGKAENFNGLLSAQVPKGISDVVFYYLPMSFVIGAILSLLTAIGIIFVLWKKPKIVLPERIKLFFCKLSSDICRQNPF